MAAKINWRRVVVEGAVIVTSILLALGADAWWQGLESNAEEEAYLVAILAEVEAVIAETERSLQINARLQDQSRERVVALQALEGGVPDTLVLASSRGHGTVRRTNAGLDAYGDLTSSGGVTKLTGAHVRQAMARLASSLSWEERMADAVLDGAMETNRDAAVIAANNPSRLATFLIRGEENGQLYRRFHSGAKDVTLDAAQAARGSDCR